MQAHPLEALTPVYRRYLAAVVLFHQRAASVAGIGTTDYQASSLLALRPSWTTGELGAALGLTSGAATRLVDRLVASGVARRVSDEEDRRKVRIEHTGRIDPSLRAALERVREPIADAISGLDEHQRDGLRLYFEAAAVAFGAATGEIAE